MVAKYQNRFCFWPALLLVLFFLAFFPSAIQAQIGGAAAISGTVTNSTGAVIPNATVTAINTATKVKTTRTSSSAGYYLLSPLPPGEYTVSVRSGISHIGSGHIASTSIDSSSFGNPIWVVETTTGSSPGRIDF